MDAELVAVDRSDGNRLRAFQELSTRARGHTELHEVIQKLAHKKVCHIIMCGFACLLAADRSFGSYSFNLQKCDSRKFVTI